MSLLLGNTLAWQNYRFNHEKCFIPAIVVDELLVEAKKYGEQGRKDKEDSIKKILKILEAENITEGRIVSFNRYAAVEYEKICERLTLIDKSAKVVDKVIAAQVISLGAILITDREKSFSLIPIPLKIENWQVLEELVFPKESKPGVLNKVVELIAKLDLNISQAICTDVKDQNIGFEITVDRKYEELPKELLFKLRGVTYKAVIDKTTIFFLRRGDKLKKQNPTHELKIRGVDRKKLLWEITKIIANYGVNITASGGGVGGKGYFSINLDLCGDNMTNDRWSSLRKELETIKDGTDGGKNNLGVSLKKI